MQREPQRLDSAHARLKSRRNHDPADNSLRAEEQSDSCEDCKHPTLNDTAPGKPEKAGDVDEAMNGQARGASIPTNRCLEPSGSCPRSGDSSAGSAGKDRTPPASPTR